MKTYSATFTSKTRGNYSGAGFAVLLYYDSSSILRFAQRDITYTTVKYIGCIDSVYFSESGFDPQDSSNINASCTIVLNDDVLTRAGVDTHSISSLINGRAFINRQCKVYRYCEGMNPIGNSPEFSGNTVAMRYDAGRRQWVIQCEHLHQHRTIPQETITKTEYPRAPKSSIGSPKPLLYGSFSMSGTGSRADAAHGLFNLAPTVCIDGTKGIYCVAGHDLYACTSTTVSTYIDGLATYGVGLYTWDGSTENYPTISLTGENNVQLQTTATNGVFRVGNVWVLPTMKGTYNTLSGDSDNAVDGDYNTQLEVAASTIYAVKFPYGSLGDGGDFNSDGTTSQLNVYSVFKTISGSSVSGGIYNPLPGTPVSYTPSSVFGTGYVTYPISAATSGTRTDADGNSYASTDQWTWGEIALYEYFLSVPSGTTLNISTLGIVANDLVVSGTIRENVDVIVSRTRGRWLGIISRPATRTWRRVTYDYQPDPYAQENGLSNVFVEATGRKFGSWIGTRNSLSSGQPITKSNYIFESILRDELGLTNSDIDQDSIDDDYASAYTMAFSLNKKEPSQNVISDLALQSGCYMYRTSTGTWKITRIPTTPSSSDVSLDYSEIAINEVGTTPQEWINNEVNVLYNYDYATGACTWNTSDEDTTSKGSTASGTNSTAKIDIIADFIRKSSDSGATNYAEALRDFRLAMWKDVHSDIEFDVFRPEYMALEEGDIVDFVNVPTAIGAIGTGSAGDVWSSFASPKTKYWLIYSRQPYQDRLRCRAIQLHDLS